MTSKLSVERNGWTRQLPSVSPSHGNGMDGGNKNKKIHTHTQDASYVVLSRL